MLRLSEAYEIKLDTFEGPLDLLLHLVIKHEMDIHDIPIAKITAQYLECLEQMEEQHLDIASEFLLMAATLIQIKSKLLLPVAQLPDADVEEVDPRVELVQRLLEYQRYKDGAQQLAAYPQLAHEVFTRADCDDSVDDNTESIAGGNVSGTGGDVGLFELVQALQGVLFKFNKQKSYHDIRSSGLTIAAASEVLLEQLAVCEHTTFSQCFADLATREEVIVLFMAILELVKLHKCRIVQLNHHGTIYIYPIKDSTQAAN